MGLVAGWSSVQYYLAERDPTKKFGTLARFQNTIFFKTPLSVLSLEKGLKKGLKILFLNCDFQRIVTTQ